MLLLLLMLLLAMWSSSSSMLAELFATLPLTVCSLAASCCCGAEAPRATGSRKWTVPRLTSCPRDCSFLTFYYLFFLASAAQRKNRKPSCIDCSLLTAWLFFYRRVFKRVSKKIHISIRQWIKEEFIKAKSSRGALKRLREARCCRKLTSSSRFSHQHNTKNVFIAAANRVALWVTRRLLVFSKKWKTTTEATFADCKISIAVKRKICQNDLSQRMSHSECLFLMTVMMNRFL